MVTPLFRVGDLVLVDNKDKVYILAVNIQDIVLNGSILYEVRYVIGNQTQNDVEQHRLSSTTILSQSSTRSGASRSSSDGSSSSISHYSSNSGHSSLNSNARSHLPSQVTPYTKLQQAIKESSKQKSSSIPLHKYLQSNDAKGKGWLRDILPFKGKKKQLTDQENLLLLVMTSMFAFHSPSSGIAIGWVSLMANAWGISRKTVNRQIHSFGDSDFTCT